MISGCREKKPRRAECLQQMQQLGASHHRQSFEVRRDIDQNCQQTVEQRLQSLMTSRDDFVEYSDQEIGMRS